MPAEPAVSVLVLCCNQAAYTQRCLAALRANTAGAGWEVIALDNGSTDHTPALLADWARQMPNLTVRRSAANLGFVRGNNLAAQSARGRLLFLLNNDTEVQPGWLEALLAVMEADPQAGAVGAKLVYPDGRLQEAGGLIFRDGAGWNFGRFDDPHDPEYNYRRESDYCSGAALLLRAGLFRALGGLDDRYYPAYWEDVDLCFRVRAHGYRVVYQPHAQILHHEGVSSGTNLRQGHKRYQLVNGRRFKRQWARTLAQQPPMPAAGQSIWQLADRASRHGRQVLVLYEALPVLAPERLARWRAWRQAGMHVCVVVQAQPDPASTRRLADLGVMVVSLEGEVAAGRSPSTAQALATVLLRRRYDVALLDDVARSADWRTDLAALSPHTEILPSTAAAMRALPDRDGTANQALFPAERAAGTAPEGLTFGSGFDGDEAGARWLGTRGALHVWQEALTRPRTLVLELGCVLAESFSRFPVKLSIECGAETLAEVWFQTNHETREVHVPVGPAAADQCLRLVSAAAPEAAGNGSGPPNKVFVLSRLRWLEAPPPAPMAAGPAALPAPAAEVHAPLPTPAETGQTDIERLCQQAAGFRQRLLAHKQALNPSAGFWYPYDTLANLAHLDQVLTGSYRDLKALAGGRPVADIGAADGDLAFFLETAGLRCHVIDHAPTNHNGLRGARLVRDALASGVEIHDLDLDAPFTWPTEPLGLALFLGILYHLKNPYYALETLARHARYCVLSTKIAAYLPDGQTHISRAPVAYLLDARECNNDATNYWVFSEAGLKRLVERTGWELLNLVRLGSQRSDPVSPAGDERAFCLLRSRP